MSFIAILMALMIEQARPMARGNPIHGWLRSWVRWAARSFDAGRPQQAALAWSFAALLPTLLVFAVYWSLSLFTGWPLAVLWSVLVLYITLGFRQFSHHFTGIRNALDDGDESKARQLLGEWRQQETGTMSHSALVGQVIEHSVIEAHRHVFGVIAWFSVLAAFGFGPAGAVFYRLCEFVPRYWSHRSLATLQPVSQASQSMAQQVWQWVDWLPARITAIGFAVVGSFEEAIESWRNYQQRGHGTNDGVILSATAGAINVRLGDGAPDTPIETNPVADGEVGPGPTSSAGGIGQAPHIGHLRTVVGLVWRSVLMWMILLFLLSLARLLG